jgi:predicted nucleotidyltransferase
MTKDFGLSEDVIKKLVSVFSEYPNIESVLVYGSRALGTHKPNSDIDMTITGSISLTELFKIETQLDDLLLPYKIDLSIFHEIDNAELIDHIHRVGKKIYG